MAVQERIQNNREMEARIEVTIDELIKDML